MKKLILFGCLLLASISQQSFAMDTEVFTFSAPFLSYPYVGYFKDDNLIIKLEELLAANATREAMVAALRQKSLLHLVVFKRQAQLIEPLIAKGFDPNENDIHKWKPLDVAVESMRCDQFNRDRSIVSEDDFQRDIDRDRDCAKELLRFGATFVQGSLLAVPSELLQGDRVRASACWRTKTWRKQVTAFVMASHPRAGEQSLLNQLLSCNGIAQEIGR